MQKKLSVCILCLLLLVACGCAKTEEETTSSIKLDVEEVAYDIASAAGFENTFNADASFLTKSYGFDEKNVTGYKAIFGTMLDANRLILFETADKNQRKEAKAVAEKVIEQLGGVFGEDAPEQKAQVEAAQIVEQGNYVLFVTGADAQAGVDVFNKLFETEKQATNK